MDARPRCAALEADLFELSSQLEDLLRLTGRVPNSAQHSLALRLYDGMRRAHEHSKALLLSLQSNPHG